MYEQAKMVLYEDMVVAESGFLQRVRKDRYGSVAGLDDSELANPDELQRQVYRDELAPILALPIQGKRCSVRVAIDEDGSFDWGAFGTVDFEGMYPFNKVLYKADKLREQVKNVSILYTIVKERIKSMAKYTVLKYLERGFIELEHIADNDMRALGRLHLRIRRLRKEIAELREAGWR